MTERQDALFAWLEAETGDAWDDADASFAAAAARWLPRSEAPAGLAARIMAAIPPARESRWSTLLFNLLASWWVRGTVATAVLVLGATLATVTPGQIWTVGTLLLTTLTAAGHGVTTSVSAAFSSGLAAWSLAASLGRAAAVIAATKTNALLLVANMALAAGAFAGLTRLLAPGEESS
jgi:hypothetical protein